MVIKCPECGNQNQLGSIFCRDCGAKLDIDKMAPEVKDGSGTSAFKIIRRIIVLLIFLAVLALIAGLLIPPGDSGNESLTQEQIEETNEKCEFLIKKLEGKTRRRVRGLIFTPAEATLAYNQLFITSSEEGSGAAYDVQKVIFTVDEKKNVHIILKTNLFNALSVQFEVVGFVFSTDEKPVAVNFSSMKMGMIPVPGFLQGNILEKYQPLLEGERIALLMEGLKSVEVDEEGNFRIRLK